MESIAFSRNISALRVPEGQVAISWLGQASFLLKAPSDLIIMIDPYLSDWAEEQWSVERIIPPPFEPEDLEPDLLLVSHWHEDHLDAPTVKYWAEGDNPGLFAGPLTCTSRALAWGWPAEQALTLFKGATLQIDDVTVVTAFARHDSPTAPPGDEIGFQINVGDIRIWYAGDTEYDARLRAMKDANIDIALIPINGVGGNMNAEEAALLMKTVAPRIAIPMHYNMWSPEDFGPGATLDPGEFAEFHNRIGGTAEIRILDVGKIDMFAP